MLNTWKRIAARKCQQKGANMGMAKTTGNGKGRSEAEGVAVESRYGCGDKKVALGKTKRVLHDE